MIMLNMTQVVSSGPKNELMLTATEDLFLAALRHLPYFLIIIARPESEIGGFSQDKTAFQISIRTFSARKMNNLINFRPIVQHLTQFKMFSAFYKIKEDS